MRRPILAVTAAALVAPAAPAVAATQTLTAAETGMFGALFEEPAGQFGTDCEAPYDPRPRCKPTANAISQLTDGRQIYWSGLEGMDNVQASVVFEYGEVSTNSGSRLLDLSGKAPKWVVPTPFDSGVNTNGNDDNEYLPGVPHSNENKANDGDLFCADLNFLADGRLITNGGTSYYSEPGVPGTQYGIIELNGLKNTRIFDPRTNGWSEAGKMTYARWYPTMVTQPDGSILTFSGVAKMIKPFYPDRPADSAANERHLERFTPQSGKWTTLPGSASKSLPLFPRMHLLPDGRTFYNAAGQVANPMGYSYDEATWNFTSVFDPKTNAWTDLGANDFGGLPLGFRGSGFSMMLMLKPGDTTARFLGVGGVPLPWPGGYVGQASTTITEVGPGTSFSSAPSGSLHSPRWYNDGVMLPTGGVWVVNGGDRDHLLTPGMDFANRTSELWDPATGRWTVTATQSHGRTYHPSAMLLPDGRVLVGGHAPVNMGYGRATDAGEKTFGTSHQSADPSFQIFSPPYLFWGKRPVITGVNPSVSTGKVLTVKVDNPAGISSIRMLRNSTVTHLVDGDQRNVELEIVGRTKNAVKVQVPGNTYLPPGPYHLFAHTMSDKGEIPSVSRQVFVDTKLPAAQTRDLMARQVGLVAQELRAGVPTVPVTTDPAGEAGSGKEPLPDNGRENATLPGAAIRTSASRRTSRRASGRGLPGRRSATLVRRAR